MYYRSNLSTIPYSYRWFLRPENPQTPYKTLQESLNIIRETASTSQNVESFYQKLIEMAPSEEERTLLSSIIKDEQTHLQYLREIYLAFTGKDVPVSGPITIFQQPKSYESGLKDALFHKWKTAKKHSIILAAMPTGYYQNLLAKMAVENVMHGSMFNYLLLKR